MYTHEVAMILADLRADTAVDAVLLVDTEGHIVGSEGASQRDVHEAAHMLQGIFAHVGVRTGTGERRMIYQNDTEIHVFGAPIVGGRALVLLFERAHVGLVKRCTQRTCDALEALLNTP